MNESRRKGRESMKPVYNYPVREESIYSHDIYESHDYDPLSGEIWQDVFLFLVLDF